MINHYKDINSKDKRVLIREDLNVPLDDNGQITSDARIQAALPTLKLALKNGAAVMVMSHMGRPTEGVYDVKFSLQPVADRLSQLLGQPVPLIKDWIDGVSIAPGEIVLLENVRFLAGETADDENLAKKMAGLCDIFVMDAFATAHRAQASTHGVAKYAPMACAGPLLSAELAALGNALLAPARPLLAVVGGSKVSTKLVVLETLVNKVDQLIVGGGIANTFLAASGYNVGKSLYEPDLLEKAKMLIAQAKAKGGAIPIPVDVVVAKEFSANSPASVKSVQDVEDDDMILDIGPETAKIYHALIAKAKTIVWNGPVGVFEMDAFAAGTKALASVIAESNAFSIAGGGDTLAAIDKYGISGKISYISTGGGAFLEFLEGKTLPAVAILEN